MTKTINPDLIVRDNEIANDRICGMTYLELAKKYNISKTRIGQVLTKPEIKDVIDTGVAQMISLIPLAVDVQLKAMNNFEKNDTLAVKAAETILKAGTILPTNQVNRTINNIYNQTNNIITHETMELVKKILPGFKDNQITDDESEIQ